MIEPINEFLDKLLSEPREDVAAAIRAELETLTTRFQALQYILYIVDPDAEEKDDSEPEPATQAASVKPSRGDISQLEETIVKAINQHGSMLPGELSKIVGIGHAHIGRIVGASKLLTKAGKLVALVT